MTTDEFRTKLGSLKKSDRSGLDGLAVTVTEQSRELVEEAVKIWMRGGGEASYKASYVLTRVQDLAIAPLLDADDTKSPARCVWRMSQIVDAQLELRNEIVLLLERMLEDKGVIPIESGLSPVEDPTPEARVCDEAYLLMRQLVHFGESSEQYVSEASVYRRTSAEERDAEIAKWRTSQTWTDLLEDADAFEEE